MTNMASASVSTSVVAGRRFASPLSRAMAQREGLDLSGLTGSGPRGRIVKADVVAALASSGAGSAALSPDLPEGPAFDAIPNGIGRKLLARRLTESKQQAPHFYVRIDCNVDAVLQLRATAKAGTGPKLSINDFVIHAAARALRAVPGVNASFTPAAIRRYRSVNIAVAVALDNGLLTPVIENTDTLSVAEISLAVKDLSERARAGTLQPGASSGGTFSVSTLGAHGVREFAAVINPPQGAILAVGAAEPRAVVRNGQLAVATMMTVTLSVDHRVIDGAVAAQWLAAFKQHLENPQVNDVWKSSLHAP